MAKRHETVLPSRNLSSKNHEKNKAMTGYEDEEMTVLSAKHLVHSSFLLSFSWTVITLDAQFISNLTVGHLPREKEKDLADSSIGWLCQLHVFSRALTYRTGREKTCMTAAGFS